MYVTDLGFISFVKAWIWANMNYPFKYDTEKNFVQLPRILRLDASKTCKDVVMLSVFVVLPETGIHYKVFSAYNKRND